MTRVDVTFPALGCEVRLLVEGAGAAETVVSAPALVERYERRLSRFRADSDLCRLNADPRPTVPTSRLLCQVVSAGVWAARATGGLVVPTLVDALERVGYAESRADARPASLSQALAAAPPRRPARPDPAGAWQRIRVDAERNLITRPIGVRLDSGGVGKGLLADVLARRLAGADRFVADCGGDLRLGGQASGGSRIPIEVQHPLTGECAHVLELDGGGVATSGIDVRLWRRPDGTFAHHLLDPATGEPAWTGLIGATAVAPTALQAETLAKAALLSGPTRGRQWVRRHGGLLFHDDGRVEAIGPHRRPVLRIQLPLGDRAVA